MEALTKALEDLKAADARFHDLLDPAGHMAKATQILAVATAETVLASITAMSERISKLEAASQPEVAATSPAAGADASSAAISAPNPESEKPSAAAPATAPAAPVPQEAAPAAEAPQSPASG